MELQRYVGEKIKEFRLKRGLSQEELAELLETTKQTVSRYENGDRKANQDILFQLSTIFNVSIDDFFPSRNTILTVAERKAEFKVDNMKSYNYFPISVSAGLPINVEPIVEAEKITIPDELLGKHAGGKNIYFTKVNGDSMNKIIPHDSLIAVKQVEKHQLKNGDIVVYSNGHDYAVKRFYDLGDKIVFKPESTDPIFTDYIIDKNNEDLRIHGKVIVYVVNIEWF